MDKEKKRREEFVRQHKLFFKKNGAKWIAPYISQLLAKKGEKR